MWTRELPFEVGHPEPRRVRNLAALLLRAASRSLDGLATRLALARPVPVAPPVMEFYSEAGAPEGALYVNGQLVGRVLGVSRL